MTALVHISLAIPMQAVYHYQRVDLLRRLKSRGDYVKRAYLETRVINELAAQANPIRTLAGAVGLCLPLISEVVLFEVACTPSKPRRVQLLTLCRDLLSWPVPLHATRKGVPVRVYWGIPPLASYGRVLEEEARAFLEGREVLNLTPESENWRAHLEEPELLTEEHRRAYVARKKHDEYLSREAHKRARVHFTKLGGDRHTSAREFLDAVRHQEHSLQLFASLFSAPLARWGCEMSRLPELFEHCPAWRAFFFGHAYTIARYAVRGEGLGRQPQWDFWDLTHSVYMPYVDVIVVGGDLLELFRWAAESAGIGCAVQQFPT